MSDSAFSETSVDENTQAAHFHQGYCWPSLGEPCGECHRCGNPDAPEHEIADDYQRNEHG